MGTRGLMAFAHNGELKGAYNHFDSYPSGLGKDMADFMVKADFTAAAKDFDRLQTVDEEVKPTDLQKDELSPYADLSVSSQSLDDWYCLLRNLQGNPDLTLKAGYYVDAIEFAKDSLFCEWAYVADLDAQTLEVYKGFQTSPHTDGRFASAEADNGYYPVRLVKTFTVAELRDNPKAMQDFENSLGDDEE